MKKTSRLERAIESMVGAFLVYVAGSAEEPYLKLATFIGGIFLTIHAVMRN